MIDMTKILVFLVLMLLLGCSPKKEAEDSVYYIITHPDSLQQRSVDDGPPPPPFAFYGYHNFILYDSSRIFYHNKYVFYSCGMGIDFSKPPRLFLAPDNLTEITLSELPAFLKAMKSRFRENEFRVYTNIASPTDTIRNPAFGVIQAYFKTKGIKVFGVRRWTEEEAFATKAKVERSAYDPESAKFETGFDHQEVPPMHPPSAAKAHKH